jgi:hypothetical protein
MRGNYLFYAIGIVVLLLVGWMLTESFTQPGVDALSGEYIELGKYRNENNTGPVQRIYAVSAKERIWEEMKAYGDFMPHTKYGRTQVYFFDAGSVDPNQTLTLQPDAPIFSEEMQGKCIAKYEKSPMGEVSFIKFPFQSTPIDE